MFAVQLMSAYAAPEGGLSGRVLSRSTKGALYGVSVHVQGMAKGASTNEMGEFTISRLSPGSYTLVFSYLGYEELTVDQLEVGLTVLDLGDVYLVDEVLSLNQVVVSPGSYSVMGTEQLSRQTLSKEEIENMSYAEDVTRAVTRLPGVTSNDYSSKFSVRGGEADEVLFLLDGMELYEPFHQRDFAGGLFSLVDVETIDGIDLMTGGYPARYGNRQSAVFDMRTKRQRISERNTTLGFSIMALSGYTDGTFSDGRGRYQLSARQGILNVLFKLADQTERTPEFYDAAGKVEWDLNDRHELSFHFLTAGDKTAIRDEAPREFPEDDPAPGQDFDRHDTLYDNNYAWLTLRSIFSKRLTARSIAYFGRIHHNRRGAMDKYDRGDKLVFSLRDRRNYQFFGLKQDWDWDISDRVYLQYGFNVKSQEADYDYYYSTDEWRMNENAEFFRYQRQYGYDDVKSGGQTAAYTSLRWKATDRLYFDSGLRHDFVSHTDDNLISPRLGVAYSLGRNTVLRGGWGYFYQSQGINELDVNHNVRQFDEAELSTHYVVGLEHTFNRGLNVRVDGYYKDISRMSPGYFNLRDPWELFPESRNDNVRLEFDGARAWGLEVFMKYDMGDKYSWWLSYAYTKAEENVTAIAFDGVLDRRLGWLPRETDQRHTIYADMNYRPWTDWLINVSWQFHTGWPYTQYTFNFTELPNGDLHWQPAHYEFRGEQFDPYHRMDVRVNRYWTTGWGRLSAYLHIINLYNRENIRKWDLDTGTDDGAVPDGQGGYVYFEDPALWFGVTPILGVSLEF